MFLIYLLWLECASVNTSWQTTGNNGTILLRSLAFLTGTQKGTWQKLTGMLQ